MIRFYLVRHGETSGNQEGKFRGREDFELNETGIAQAKLLGQELSSVSFHAIYSSPLVRAMKTAEIIASYHQLKVIPDDRLTNISLGSWEGVPRVVIKKQFPHLFQLWNTTPEKLIFPGMEPLRQVQKRVMNFIHWCVDQMDSDSDMNIGIVTHRAVLKPLIAGALKIPAPYFWKIQVDTASYSILEYHKERQFTLRLLNQTYHLQQYAIKEKEG